MPIPKSTTVCLVIRSQAWFCASVILETLCPFNVAAIEQFPFPPPNMVNLRTWIGKGPCACDIGATGIMHFDHGEESYPIFTWPSVGPKGGSLYVTPVMRKLVIDEQTAVFCLEGATSIPVAPELFSQAPETFRDADRSFIQESLNKTQDLVHGLAGAYSLYQYPLVWDYMEDYMDERHQWTMVDVVTKEGKPGIEEPKVDNWIPFRLDVSTKITSDGMLRDGITQHFAELIKEDFPQPFIFLKDSMWHADIRTRFLLQFWIIEYYADKYSEAVPVDYAVQGFIENLENIVKERLPSFVDYFTLRKGELTRLTLSQKVQHCLQTVRIRYNDKLFRRAKAARDRLSHATKCEESELREMELYVRELVRHLIRRDLELQGIFLDGETKSKSDLEEIIPAYPEPSERLTKEFGPLEAK